MLGSWGVVVEVFGVVSGQGDDEEYFNVLNVRTWVKVLFCNMNRAVSQRPHSNVSLILFPTQDFLF